MRGLQPILPLPGAEVDAEYMSRLVRQIEAYLIRASERGETKSSTISATQLTSNGNGLRVGDFFTDENGSVRVCLLNVAYPLTVDSVTAIGSVTVVTS